MTVRYHVRSDNCGHFLGLYLLSPRHRNTLFIPILSRGRGREEPALTRLVPVAVARHSLPFAVGRRHPRHLLRLAFPATKHFAAALYRPHFSQTIKMTWHPTLPHFPSRSDRTPHPSHHDTTSPLTRVAPRLSNTKFLPRYADFT